MESSPLPSCLDAKKQIRAFTHDCSFLRARLMGKGPPITGISAPILMIEIRREEGGGIPPKCPSLSRVIMQGGATTLSFLEILEIGGKYNKI